MSKIQATASRGVGKWALEFRELLGRLVVGTVIRSAGGAPVAVLVRRQVQVEESSVELAAKEEAARLVPAERWALPAAVAGEVTKFLSRVEKLEDPRNHEFELGAGEGIGREHRNLLHREIRQAGSADLLANDEIEDERVEGAQQGGDPSSGGGGKHEQELVPDCCKRDDVCDRRPFLHATGYVAPAHQPAGRGADQKLLGEGQHLLGGSQ